jgi:hypothetical protein
MNTATPTPPNGGNLRQRLLRGTLLKWTENTGWLDRDGVRPADGPYLLWGLEEGLQCWQNQTVVDEIIDKPLPDLNELNGSIPLAQWEAGLDGHPRPPYVHQYAIYLLDPNDGQFYTLINSTVGMRMLWESLSERWEVMRHLRGPDVVAVASLSDRPFRAGKWGIKHRPDLKIEWRKAVGGGPYKLVGPTTRQLPPSEPAGATSALSAPSTPPATATAPPSTPSALPARPEPPASPAARSAPPSGAPTRPASAPSTEQKSSRREKEEGLAFLDPVKPITTSEEIDDAIRF